MALTGILVVIQKAARISFLATLALFLILGAPTALMKSLRRVKQGWDLRHEAFIESRKRLFGAEYVDGIEAIRKSIPPDGEYLLVREQGADDEAELWVRYDLAPRRAVFLDQSVFSLARGETPSRGAVEAVPQLAVIARDRGKAPQLVATTLLFPAIQGRQPVPRENPAPSTR